MRRLVAAEGDVAVADGLFLGGFADDGVLFNVPDGGVAVPVLQCRAVEDLFVAGVVVEVEGSGSKKP